MLSAAVLPFTACQTGGENVDGNEPGSGDEGGGVVEVLTPTVELTLVEGSVTANSFVATVVTTNAEAAAWKVLSHSEAAPEAAVVLDEGASLELPENGPATVAVEYLDAETEYCLYVAVKAGEQYALSAPLCVTTLAASSTDNPDTPVDPGTTTVPVVEFYADVTMNNGELITSTNLANVLSLPGHWVTLSGGDIVATLLILDRSVEVEQYSYLNSGVYPVVAGSVDMGSVPTTSCLVADHGYCNFYDSATGKTYFPVVSEEETDTDGMPYGVIIEMTPATTGQDLNYLMFNVPVEDEDGNKALVQGSYTGPLGYQLGSTKATEDFDFEKWGFSTFEATYNESYKILSLKSMSSNGNLTLSFDLNETNGVFAANKAFVGSETLNGTFWNALDDLDFTVDSGRVLVETTATSGQYKLVITEHNPLVFWGDKFDYQTVGEFTITVTGMPEGM